MLRKGERWLRLTAQFAGILLICALSAGGQARHNANPPPSIRVDRNLVLVPVTVCDSRNRVISGLDKEHFRVFDDNVEQSVTEFFQEDEPIAIGLVFDTSASMGNKLSRSRDAANAFLSVANEEDEFFAIEFNDRPRLTVPLTRDTREIPERLFLTKAHGRTALLDAVYLALQEIKKSAKSRKALLIISDGGDNASRYRGTEVKSLARESDVLIYGLGIYGAAGTAEELYGPTLLSQIAELTGGREFPIADINDMPEATAKIGIELRNRYVLGFSPPAVQRDGRYHRLRVKLLPPPAMPRLNAYWRPGYYAPEE
ncbi:MAG: VWA domain-containing protein [Terriglobia bacterium]|nr:MAG: VWA domain-containing protein [Terriglobia bacterium]